MSYIEEVEGLIRRTAEAVGPSVAGIAGPRLRVGSGVVIAPGKVLTAAVGPSPERLTVTLGDGQASTPSAIENDPGAHLAVLSVNTGDTAAAEWGDPGALATGSAVLALANPSGSGLRVTLGHVSATGRTFRTPGGRSLTGAVEHSAPLARGSAGGPLVDRDGRLLGLNMLRRQGGLILARALDAEARERVDRLLRGEAAAPPRLGLALAPSGVARRLRRAVGLPEREGLLVRAVQDGTPAARAGLVEGDLIVAADGEEVSHVDDMYGALDRGAGAGTLTLRYVRGVEEHDVEITLAGDVV